MYLSKQLFYYYYCCTMVRKIFGPVRRTVVLPRVAADPAALGSFGFPGRA